MNTAHLIYDLPHIVALKTELDRAHTALDLSARHARREPLCPLASAAYDDATRKYFDAVGDARAELKIIETSIAMVYALPEVEKPARHV